MNNEFIHICLIIQQQYILIMLEKAAGSWFTIWRAHIGKYWRGPVETSKQTRRRRNPALKEGEGMVEKWKLNTDQSLMFIHFTGESWRLQRKMVLQTWLNQSLSWKGIWKSCWCTLNTSDFLTFIVVVMKLRIAKFYFHATDIMLGWTCLLMKDVMIQMWVSYTYNMRSDMAVIKW